MRTARDGAVVGDPVDLLERVPVIYGSEELRALF
jgi:hypothetical protein